MNIASPRYVCENCEVALLATQNPETSKFLPLISQQLKQAGMQLPVFSSLRMITCISSYMPFHSDRIKSDLHEVLAIDFRQSDIILSKDISEIFENTKHTQFHSTNYK